MPIAHIHWITFVSCHLDIFKSECVVAVKAQVCCLLVQLPVSVFTPI